MNVFRVAGKEENVAGTPELAPFRFYGHQFIYKSIGYTARELSLPRIAVVNSWGEQSPGHSHLRAVAEGVKAGIRMAGGMPFEINVAGLCTVPSRVPSDILYDMPRGVPWSHPLKPLYT